MKSLAIITIILLCSFNAKSQTSSDSTKLSNAEVKTLLQIGDDWKRLTREVTLLIDQSNILSEKIFMRDTLIASQKNAIAGYEIVVRGYQTSEQNIIQQRDNLQIEVKQLRRKARWNNTKSFITSAALIAVGVLYILK